MIARMTLTTMIRMSIFTDMILPTEYICFAFDQLLSASSPLIAHARTDLFFLHFPIEVHIRPKLTKQVDQPIR